jgi:hypothetical protein
MDAQAYNTATHYLLNEGGSWKPIVPENGFPSIRVNIFAVMFANGWIWDRIAGWRQVTYCPTCGNKWAEKPDFSRKPEGE